MTTTTFGYASVWSKEPKDSKGLKTLLEEYSLPAGLCLSGKIKIKPDMAQELIEYLQDPANCGQYGIELDIAFFYDEEKPVAISGKLTTPYKKSDNTQSTSKLQSRRSV